MRVTRYGGSNRSPSAFRKRAVDQAVRMARLIFDDASKVEGELRAEETLRKRAWARKKAEKR
jgi:hypothetical protein